MIGIWSEFSQQYLIIWAILTSVFFTIPLFFMPITWAKVLQWNIPTDTDLAIYFGRCLGGVGLAICALALHAGIAGQGTVVVFKLLFGAFSFLTIAHIWGAIQGIQPITETLEIVFWFGLVLLNAAFYPTA
jgi:hypothetical protein